MRNLLTQMRCTQRSTLHEKFADANAMYVGNTSKDVFQESTKQCFVWEGGSDARIYQPGDLPIIWYSTLNG